MVAYIFSPSTWQADLCELQASLVYTVSSGQQGLDSRGCRDPVSKIKSHIPGKTLISKAKYSTKKKPRNQSLCGKDLTYKKVIGTWGL